jgi:hypothetical protein
MLKIATAIVQIHKIVLHAKKAIPIAANLVLQHITFKSYLRAILLSNSFALLIVNLVTMQTLKMNVSDALHFAKNALPTQCVLLATK